MKIRKKEKENFVRILIGNAITGQSNISKPVRTINVDGASVEEVEKKIKEMIEKND